MPNLLDMLLNAGSQIRYGVTPEEKYKMLVNQQAPGMPQPFGAGGDPNPEAERYLSNYLGAQKWGEGPATLFNQVRYLIDNNPEAFSAGLRGAKAGTSPLEQVMMARIGE